MNDIWTIQAALDWTVGYLERKGDENPRLSAQWLLSEATGLSRIELYANFEQPLSMGERDVPVSYTHLDVYKRQAPSCAPASTADS